MQLTIDAAELMTTLILRVSQGLARCRDLAAAAHLVALRIGDLEGVAGGMVQLRSASKNFGRIVGAEGFRFRREMPGQRSSLLVVFDSQPGNLPLLITSLEAVAFLVDNFASLADQQARGRLLAAEWRQLRNELAADKAAARAAGILAAHWEWTAAEARVWMESEAAERRMPLQRLAEQVIANQLTQENAA